MHNSCIQLETNKCQEIVELNQYWLLFASCVVLNEVGQISMMKETGLITVAYQIIDKTFSYLKGTIIKCVGMLQLCALKFHTKISCNSYNVVR